MTNNTARLIAAVELLPVITAPNMLSAQAWTITPAARLAITEVADSLEALGAERRVSLKVVDFDGHTIGSLSVTHP